MAAFCGECGADIELLGEQVRHPQLNVAYVLCGTTGKRTLTYQSAVDVPPPPPDPVAGAREALAALITALEYHEVMESTPCEVRAVEGWKDVMDLAVEIGKALDSKA